MNNKYQALILAAGEGKRLMPFTLEKPKCLARVNGCTILENSLNILANNGCTHTTIVIGHHADVIKELIAYNFSGMPISYVENHDFRSTNSMYSLTLGLDAIDEPAWILEGDVFFENSIINLPTRNHISWFVDSSIRELDGAYIEYDSKYVAKSLEIIRDVNFIRPGQSKSVGILKLSRNGVNKIKEWLKNGVASGHKNEYYDLTLGTHLNESLISVVDVAGLRWFEIDTLDDLEKANRIFC
ncbi:phosphocholine cytidylyltransferase family protein [Methylomonas sp. LL1]|uniref:phosphocholine cytidylyltransferase family protein n=1 Tax=Methylomonas sp. LL1 TaxID=2785785 RepID=UPI0018C402E1|nr:phosphocholine cytidylyltransferase family protein [Methylomonas sp. LL1]QPK63432.1 phosphocholine cytidylyltransferase family protein [Methylomonas sp. LL1]